MHLRSDGIREARPDSARGPVVVLAWVATQIMKDDVHARALSEARERTSVTSDVSAPDVPLNTLSEELRTSVHMLETCTKVVQHAHMLREGFEEMLRHNYIASPSTTTPSSASAPSAPARKRADFTSPAHVLPSSPALQRYLTEERRGPEDIPVITRNNAQPISLVDALGIMREDRVSISGVHAGSMSGETLSRLRHDCVWGSAQLLSRVIETLFALGLTDNDVRLNNLDLATVMQVLDLRHVIIPSTPAARTPSDAVSNAHSFAETRCGHATACVLRHIQIATRCPRGDAATNRALLFQPASSDAAAAAAAAAAASSSSDSVSITASVSVSTSCAHVSASVSVTPHGGGSKGSRARASIDAGVQDAAATHRRTCPVLATGLTALLNRKRVQVQPAPAELNFGAVLQPDELVHPDELAACRAREATPEAALHFLQWFYRLLRSARIGNQRFGQCNTSPSQLLSSFAVRVRNHAQAQALLDHVRDLTLRTTASTMLDAFQHVACVDPLKSDTNGASWRADAEELHVRFMEISQIMAPLPLDVEVEAIVTLGAMTDNDAMEESVRLTVLDALASVRNELQRLWDARFAKLNREREAPVSMCDAMLAYARALQSEKDHPSRNDLARFSMDMETLDALTTLAAKLPPYTLCALRGPLCSQDTTVMFLAIVAHVCMSPMWGAL